MNPKISVSVTPKMKRCMHMVGRQDLDEVVAGVEVAGTATAVVVVEAAMVCLRLEGKG